MLFVFVEGLDDESFIKSIFAYRWKEYKIIQYSGMLKKAVDNFIKSIKCMPNSDYIFLADSDGKDNATRIAELQKKHPSLEIEKIYVVRYEIESWYYAGASSELCHHLKIKFNMLLTDCMTKEQFYQRLTRPSERSVVMAQILEKYDLELALKRNDSLKSFTENMELKERAQNAVL